MTERTYYTTQTRLAFGIQTDIYANYYLYVAVAYNAVGNHPTSNPRSVAALWCGVTMPRPSRADLNRWEQHKARLRQVALQRFAQRHIDLDQYLEIMTRIAVSTPADAAPILMMIPHDNSYTLKAGETHVGYEETEEEYIITDLKPFHNFSAITLDCEQLDGVL